MRVEYTVVLAPLQKGGPSEDAVVVAGQEGDGRQFFAVVVDGHGWEKNERGVVLSKSPRVAAFARDVADGLLAQFRQFPNPTSFPHCFDAVARHVDAVYRPLVESESNAVARLEVGAVASCVLVTGDHVHLAQTGDCRLYGTMSDWSGGFRRLSRDHDGNNPDEIRRLRPFLNSGTFRLMPPPSGGGFPRLPHGTPDRLYKYEVHGCAHSLAPTRTFGDWEFQPAVTHLPECRAFELSQFAPGEIFALCSDGGNWIVEAVYTRFSGRTRSTPLPQVAAFASSLTPRALDDVSIVFFRVMDA